MTLLGQYRAQSHTERLYSQVSFGIYYHTSSTDWTAPTVSGVSMTRGGPSATITVSASDASGIQAVIVVYTDNHGAWHNASLALASGQWSGAIPATLTTQYFVQVVDQAGNVKAVDDGGKYFQVDTGAYHTYLPVTRR